MASEVLVIAGSGDDLLRDRLTAPSHYLNQCWSQDKIKLNTYTKDINSSKLCLKFIHLKLQPYPLGGEWVNIIAWYLLVTLLPQGSFGL